MLILPTIYDADLKKLAHYQSFPQMLPFIGEHYADTKLLLVGESHYLPKDSIIQQNAATWYESNVNDLATTEQTWTNTRKVLDDFLKNGLSSSKAYTVWANPENAIQEQVKSSGFDLKSKKGYEHLAFYNFFQRPAETQGGSINPTNLDRLKAEETLAHLIKVIEPKFIMFTSSKTWNNISWDFISKYSSIKFDYCPHPAREWWNMKAKKYGNLT